MKNKGYAKFWGVEKVYYGRCANGECKFARKGRWEGENGRDSPCSFSFPWTLAVRHQSFAFLACLYSRPNCEKRRARGRGRGESIRFQFIWRNQLVKYNREEKERGTYLGEVHGYQSTPLFICKKSYICSWGERPLQSKSWTCPTEVCLNTTKSLSSSCIWVILQIWTC